MPLSAAAIACPTERIRAGNLPPRMCIHTAYTRTRDQDPAATIVLRTKTPTCCKPGDDPLLSPGVNHNKLHIGCWVLTASPPTYTAR